MTRDEIKDAIDTTPAERLTVIAAVLKTRLRLNVERAGVALGLGPLEWDE